MMRRHERILTALIAATAFRDAPAAGAQRLPHLDPASATDLRFRYIGPSGNRVAAVAGVPGDPNVYYAGAASGGIWKTVDAGIHWAPIFDGLKTLLETGAPSRLTPPSMR